MNRRKGISSIVHLSNWNVFIKRQTADAHDIISVYKAYQSMPLRYYEDIDLNLFCTHYLTRDLEVPLTPDGNLQNQFSFNPPGINDRCGEAESKCESREKKTARRWKIGRVSMCKPANHSWELVGAVPKNTHVGKVFLNVGRSPYRRLVDWRCSIDLVSRTCRWVVDWANLHIHQWVVSSVGTLQGGISNFPLSYRDKICFNRCSIFFINSKWLSDILSSEYELKKM